MEPMTRHPKWLDGVTSLEAAADQINRLSIVERQAIAVAIISDAAGKVDELADTALGAYLFAKIFDPAGDPSVLADLAEEGWYIHDPAAEAVEAVRLIGQELADKRRSVDQVGSMLGHFAAMPGGPASADLNAAKAKLAEALESPDVDRFVQVIGYYPVRDRSADDAELHEVEDQALGGPTDDGGEE